jgi:hypothetical protein
MVGFIPTAQPRSTTTSLVLGTAHTLHENSGFMMDQGQTIINYLIYDGYI